MLLQMLMVLFDILVSHRQMSRWHEKRIQAHLKDQQATQHAKQELLRRLKSNGEASTSQAASAEPSSIQPATGQLSSSRQAPGNEEPSGSLTDSAPSQPQANGNVRQLCEKAVSNIQDRNLLQMCCDSVH